MASLLMDADLDRIGARRVKAIYEGVFARVGPSPLIRGTVAHKLCQDTALRFLDVLAEGASLPSAIAAVVMGSLRLGWGLAYDQIEQDVALVNAVTGEEG